MAGKLINIISWMLIGLAILISVLLGGIRLLGFTPYAVSTGSMEPAYHVGSVVYVRHIDAGELRTGDVITFRLGGETFATHRIVEVLEDDGLYFRTKGDANGVTDAVPVSADRVEGKVYFTIPYLGYCAAYLDSLGSRAVAVLVSVTDVSAWLADATGSVANNFNTAVPDIDIIETDTGIDGDENDKTNSYEIVPGDESREEIAKDPAVIIPADAMDCWVFVKLEATESFDALLYYEIAEGWTELGGEKNVYYRTSSKSQSLRRYSVLKDDMVKIRKTVTKDRVNELTKGAYPGLKITAFSVQYAGFDSASAAWREAGEHVNRYHS